ncbi:MAG: 2-C-methyl-D-erythritol 4-phosphate cytidylyltransferase [Pseudomonadota bacterium]
METRQFERSGTAAAIIPAGGAGQRFGPCQPKQFVELAGWPVLAHTLARFDQISAVDQVVIAIPPHLLEQTRSRILEPFGFGDKHILVAGGATRQESVYLGFMALGDDVDLVVVHDAVRPLVKASVIEDVIEKAREKGAAIAAVPVRDTLKRVEHGVIQGTLDRSLVWQAQTPQAFRRDILAEALAAAKRDGFQGTDEAALVERLGYPVYVVQGAPDNLKITMPEDLVLAEALIDYTPKERGMRVGMGYDVHKLVPGRRLMLGGVEIPFDRGLEGHSDADVIVHAFCDALLGAAGLKDIGVHFPDSSPDWADAAGVTLLDLVAKKIREQGFELANADLTLLAEAPKIKGSADRMVRTMARALSVEPSRINLKATTMEGLGPVGREEGLAALAVVLLSKRAG